MLRLFSFLLLLETLCFSQYNPDYLNYMCSETKKPFFRFMTNGDGTRTVLPGRQYSHYFKFEIPNRTGKKRIFIVGESAAMILYNNENDNFFDPAFLRKFEVFDFGMAAYDSSRLLEVFNEALELKPDMILAMAGNNGGFFYSCPGPADTIRRALLNLRRKYFSWSGREKEALAEYSTQIYKRAFLKMARLARAANVKIFFVILPVNYFFPPSGRLPETPGFLKAYKSYSEGRYNEASRLFMELLAEKKDDPFANYYAGRSFYALKKYSKAAYYFKTAVSYDPWLDRASDLTNRMIREIAFSEGAGLVDLESFFLSISPNGIIEEKYFSDGVHWQRKYNHMVQGFIFKTVTGENVRIPLPSADNEDDRRNLLRYAVSYINNEKGGINERAIYMIDRFLDTSRLKPAEMTKDYVRALLRDNLWLNLTNTLDMWWHPFQLHLGETMRRRGQVSAALKIFEEVARVNPEDLEIQMRLCEVSSRTGSYDIALMACSRAVELAEKKPLNYPSDRKAVLLKDALVKRARVYEKTGKKELAEKDRLKAENIARRISLI